MAISDLSVRATFPNSVYCFPYKFIKDALVLETVHCLFCFPSSNWGLIIKGFIFLWGHVLILCPFSWHIEHVLLPVGKCLLAWVPLNFTPVTWGQVLRLWPLWQHILQRCFLVTAFPWLLDIEFWQVLLLWPFSPHNRHINCLPIKLSLSSGQ